MDAQLSYLRQLIGDTTTPYTYTDVALRALIAAPQPTSALPETVKAAAALAFQQFPVR